MVNSDWNEYVQWCSITTLQMSLSGQMFIDSRGIAFTYLKCTPLVSYLAVDSLHLFVFLKWEHEEIYILMEADK